MMGLINDEAANMSDDKEDHSQLISWNSIILVALGTAHLAFSQITSSLFVVAMAFFVGLDLVFPKMPDETENGAARHQYLIHLTKIALIFFLVALAVILPTGYNIINRLAEGPAKNATDGLIQTELAIAFVLEGKNPYVEIYHDTILGDWKGGEPPWTNSPLFHFVYLPFLFLSSIPFFLLSKAFLGWYDQRVLYIILFFASLLLLPSLVRRQRQKLTIIILVGLNFLSAFFLADGRNDAVIFFGLLLTTVLLSKGHLKLSALILGLTLMTKHQAWFFLPFSSTTFTSRGPLAGQSITNAIITPR